MIHTFLPAIIDNKTGRISYLNVAHIEQIEPTSGMAYIVGQEDCAYRLAPGWEFESNQLRIGNSE